MSGGSLTLFSDQVVMRLSWELGKTTTCPIKVSQLLSCPAVDICLLLLAGKESIKTLIINFSQCWKSSEKQALKTFS